jgi:hypothetical protein
MWVTYLITHGLFTYLSTHGLFAYTYPPMEYLPFYLLTQISMIEFGKITFVMTQSILITFSANVKGCVHSMFLHIMNIIVAPNSYFQHKCDACGALGLSLILK